MNWDAISALGELTGAIAVVITLGYLALQTKAAREIASICSELGLFGAYILKTTYLSASQAIPASLYL
jgi:hypothetical protein